MNDSSPLRIALLTYSTKPRGSVIHTLELANALHRLGHGVQVFALDKDGQGFDFPLLCHYEPVPARPAPSETDALICQRIEEFVEHLAVNYLVTGGDRPFDIYHAQDCIGANALGILRDRQMIPHYVRTVHHIEDYRSPYLRDCQDRSIRGADQCLCVSAGWQQALQQSYGIDAPRVVNGVNVERFSAQPSGQETRLQQQLGLTGSPIYLTVGGIEPRKNSIRLLQAFAQVREVQPTAQLLIAGGATLFDYQTYRDQFLATADALGMTLGTSVVLPGVIPDVLMPVLYRCGDGFVFPSVKEGWGLVVLEAIASGLPVLTANQPPFTEFLSEQQAILVEPESVEAIAQGMLRLTEPHHARALAQASQPILSDYRWETSAQMHLHSYRQLLLNRKIEII